jgi:hypothetical protein
MGTAHQEETEDLVMLALTNEKQYYQWRTWSARVVFLSVIISAAIAVTLAVFDHPPALATYSGGEYFGAVYLFSLLLAFLIMRVWLRQENS